MVPSVTENTPAQAHWARRNGEYSHDGAGLQEEKKRGWEFMFGVVGLKEIQTPARAGPVRAGKSPGPGEPCSHVRTREAW
jgi:hypothetical protein